MIVTCLAAVVLVLAVAFTFTIGFHDASNATATVQASGTLTMQVSLWMAAAGNLLGALVMVQVVGQDVLASLSSGLLDHPSNDVAVRGAVAALTAAIVWNLLTWWRGMPSSSTHALLGGVVGAALVNGLTVGEARFGADLILPLLFSPVLAVVLVVVLLLVLIPVLARVDRTTTSAGARMALTIASAGTAVLHGAQDSAKTAGIGLIALWAAGWHPDGDSTVPIWLLVSLAVAMALGTLVGGQRITRTIATRLTTLDFPRALAAQSSAALVLLGAAVLRVPVSTTYTLVSAVVGAGATSGRRFRVRWPVVGQVAATWLLTTPTTAMLGAIVAVLLLPLS